DELHRLYFHSLTQYAREFARLPRHLAPSQACRLLEKIVHGALPKDEAIAGSALQELREIAQGNHVPLPQPPMPDVPPTPSIRNVEIMMRRLQDLNEISRMQHHVDFISAFVALRAIYNAHPEVKRDDCFLFDNHA